jgi:hypothetical protein
VSFNIQNLSDLSQSQVDQAYSLIVQMVQENDPTVDVKRGAIRDLVLYLSGILSAADQANIDRVRQSNSLEAINQNPALADPALVDLVASNYKITRFAGTVAKGAVVIVLNSQINLVVPKGSRFTTSTGLVFTTDDAYTARIDPSGVVATTDRLLFDLGNGTYSFIVNVTSTDIGSQYKLPIDTTLFPPFLDPAVQSAYTAADFIGGADPESNEALMTRLRSGISSKSLSNRPSIEALIRSVGNYDDSFAVSTVGYGDQEMQRYHSILPVAFGGRTDVYVRTSPTVQRITVTKTAQFIGTSSSGRGIWQLAFGRDEFPGFYEIIKITKPGNIPNQSVVGYSITSDVRGFDISVGTTPGTGFLPDLANAKETRYSRYQTATVQFVDTDKLLTGLVIGSSTASYDILLSQLPDIAAIQDVVSDRQNRFPIGDCLVKAAVPCFVTATIFISKRTIDAQPDTTAISNAAAHAINTLGFVQQVPISLITSAVQKVLTAGAVTSLTLQGKVRRPDGTILNINSTTVLDVGNDPLNLVSKYTVGFFLNPADVTVNVTNVDSSL